jgi:hypothetical protein
MVLEAGKFKSMVAGPCSSSKDFMLCHNKTEVERGYFLRGEARES